MKRTTQPGEDAFAPALCEFCHPPSARSSALGSVPPLAPLDPGPAKIVQIRSRIAQATRTLEGRARSPHRAVGDRPILHVWFSCGRSPRGGHTASYPRPPPPVPPNKSVCHLPACRFLSVRTRLCPKTHFRDNSLATLHLPRTLSHDPTMVLVWSLYSPSMFLIWFFYLHREY